MTSSKRFLWSDAWLFQAIAIASHARPATLSEIIGAADAVNHALPTDEELHGALLRLTADQFVEEVGDQFRLTDRVPKKIRAAIVEGGWRTGRAAASKFLDAESWNVRTNVKDPRNAVVYPGLTDVRIQQADREYRQRVKMRERSRQKK